MDFLTIPGIDEMIHHPIIIMGREPDRDRPLRTIGEPLAILLPKVRFGKARCPFGEDLRPPDRFVERLSVAVDGDAVGAREQHGPVPF